MNYEQHPPPQQEPPDGGAGMAAIPLPTDAKALKSRTVVL